MKRWFNSFRGSVRIFLFTLVGLLAVLSAPVIATDLPIQGGPGGNESRADCPSGSYIVGLLGSVGKWIDRIRPVCAPWLAVENRFGYFTPGKQKLGTSSGGTVQERTCPHGYAINGWNFKTTVGDNHQPKFVNFISATCIKVTPPLDIQPLHFGNLEILGQILYASGSRLPGGNQFCPANELATGFRGRAGLFVDALGLVCRGAPGSLTTSNQFKFKPGAETSSRDIPYIGKVYTPPSQAGKTTAALSTAPKIISPQSNTRVISSAFKIQIVPQSHFSGTHILVHFTKLGAPAGQLTQTFPWVMPTSELAKGASLPTNIFTSNLGGPWSVRARVESPKPGDFSADVPFTFAPVATTKPRAQFQLQGR